MNVSVNYKSKCTNETFGRQFITRSCNVTTKCILSGRLERKLVVRYGENAEITKRRVIRITHVVYATTRHHLWSSPANTKNHNRDSFIYLSVIYTLLALKTKWHYIIMILEKEIQNRKNRNKIHFFMILCMRLNKSY